MERDHCDRSQFFAPNNVVATVWNGTTPTTLGYLPGTNHSNGNAIK
jgi:hypothetical protein